MHDFKKKLKNIYLSIYKPKDCLQSIFYSTKDNFTTILASEREVEALIDDLESIKPAESSEPAAVDNEEIVKLR